MKTQVNRLRELDFLRGIAIILVIFRHKEVFHFLKQMGWIGVDLFFVLSGFLVSGLLFREYQNFGNIKPKLFLIRRGFKIYPIYYLTYIIYIIPRLILHKKDIGNSIYDLVFVQNYFLGWGYAYAASWSLAVEEHFYFGLALLLWIVFNKKAIRFDSKPDSSKITFFEKMIFMILIITLLLRVYNNIYLLDQNVKNMTMTHLRIDSLLFGVLISYWYHFRKQTLMITYSKYRKILLVSSLLLLSFTPFFEPLETFFVMTIGFSMLYVAFGIILIHFLVYPNINQQLNAIFSRRIVDFVSKIGFCSYSIYVIHTFVIYCESFLGIENEFLGFALVFIGSVVSGFVMTYTIEDYFLKIRNKFFQNRVS
ncbi:MAG TPA: acyltransferase [Flavobacterium lutivivi]|nr:acyltransferase [Flavobacterium lutivivi]